MSVTPTKKRNLWPLAIIGYFIVFITSMVIFIGWAVRQKEDLVRPDYYAEEIRFQQHVDRVARTRQLSTVAKITYDDRTRAIALVVPREHQKASGFIQLYRPSDATQDKKIPLSLNADGAQRIDTRGLAAGLWKVRFYWKVADQEFYTDESIVISG